MDAVARMLDANANRAGEALRTLEDLARFGLEDAARSARLKELRHGLASVLAALPPGWLIANRDTAGDVGTAAEAAGEYLRSGLADVATAAGKRLGEALRVIEEVLKTIDPGQARGVESIRYRAYDVAAEIGLRLPGRRREQWRVCVLVSESLCRRPWQDVVRAAIEGGAECIQLREKSLDGRELAERAAWIAGVARPHAVRTIVNDRVDVALVAGADGVHVGQSDLSPSLVRRVAGQRLTIGMSTHDLGEAARAVEDGADYCGVGAVFPTSVKPSVEASGLAYLKAFLSRNPHVPHLAIGGITPDVIGSLADAGCRGVAVSSCVCAAEHPDRVVKALREALPSSDRSPPAGIAR